MSALKEQALSSVLDVLGKAIPYPLYLTKKTIGKMEQGQVLKVLCDTPESADDSIPRFAEKMGYPIERVRLENMWEIYIRKI